VEGFGDLGDGVAAFAVDVFLVIHLGVLLRTVS
jgi:hypothetical protein